MRCNVCDYELIEVDAKTDTILLDCPCIHPIMIDERIYYPGDIEHEQLIYSKQYSPDDVVWSETYSIIG